MKMLAFACAAALFGLQGCATPASELPKMYEITDTAYRLGAGDEVRITVYGMDQMTNTYVVGDGGTISLPLLETMPVEGKTPAEVEKAIADAILAKQLVLQPSVSAQVQKYRPFYILGEVQKPGQYPYAPGLSVTSAVSIAGGFTFRADKTQFAIQRKSGQKMVKGQVGPDAPVLPGDTVTVYESWF
ncbi:polysaccharide biosynthesis/export family protein [Sphingomonas cavernae]|uniref:Polysaccharide export protein n=1 Tax=Sphingomonas cavernae TaxID=2320861 RepID=A0A418WQW5_9SPHN|nr:polysaccharide biosynthesis/export family protein [Sphingomonas cavernae]RJF93645.1 polysaccharide export protein [Sphingomonas cavernae]